MSATVDFAAISATVWTDVSGASLTGYVSNVGDQVVLYREAASLPAASVDTGHKLKPGDSVNYVITAGAIYARTKQFTGHVVVTGA